MSDTGQDILESNKDADMKSKRPADKKKLMLAEIKEAKRKQEILNRYELEQKLCNVNMKKVCDKWEKFLTESKRNEINEDLTELRETIGHYQDLKSNICQLLMDEYDEIADCRWGMASSFINALDRLLEIGMCQVRRLRGEYQENVKVGVSDLGNNLTAIEEKEARNLEYLKLVTFQQSESTENSCTVAKERQEEAILGLESEFWMEKEKIEHETDETIEWIIVEMQTRIKSFLYFSKSKRTEVDVLGERDTAFRLTMDKDFIRCKMLRAEIKSLNKCMEKIEERRKELEKTRIEKKELMKRYMALQLMVKDNEELDRKKLRMLTILSDNTIQNLKRKFAVVHRLLRVKEHCGRFEYENEIKTLRSKLFQGIGDPIKAGINGFVEQVGKTHLEFNEAKKELKELEDENLELQNIMGRHFKAMKKGLLSD